MVVVGGAAVVAPALPARGLRCRERDLRVSQVLLGLRDVALRGVDRGRRRGHCFLGCREVGTAGLDVTDGGLAVGSEELAVAIEHCDVVRSVAAELLLRRRQGTVGRVEVALRGRHLRLSGSDGVCRRRRSRRRSRPGRAPRVVATCREHKCDTCDDRRAPHERPTSRMLRMHSCLPHLFPPCVRTRRAVWGWAGTTARSSGALQLVRRLRGPCSRIGGHRAFPQVYTLAATRRSRVCFQKRSMTMLTTRIATSVTAVAGSSTSVVNANVTNTVTVLAIPSNKIAAFAPVSCRTRR